MRDPDDLSEGRSVSGRNIDTDSEDSVQERTLSPAPAPIPRSKQAIKTRSVFESDSEASDSDQLPTVIIGLPAHSGHGRGIVQSRLAEVRALKSEE